MTVSQVLLVFSWIVMMFRSTVACDLNVYDLAICEKDIGQFCKIEQFSSTIKSIADSRDCLRKNRDSITKECLDYLQLDKPSIIEACLPELVGSRCSKTVPGCYNIYSCLSEMEMEVEKLSPDCQEILVNGQRLIDKLPAKGFQVALWNSWTKSFAAMSEYLLAVISQVSQQGLRGSMYIEITGNEEEGSMFLSYDLKNIDSDENNGDKDVSKVSVKANN